MGKRGVLLVILIVLLASFVYSVNVDSEVYDEIGKDGYARVIVKLKEDSGLIQSVRLSSLKTMSKEQVKKVEFDAKKIRISNQQDKVLSRLNVNKVEGKRNNFFIQSFDKTDFELRHKYSTVNEFSGLVTEEGLKKLELDSHVERIGVVKLAYAHLDVSVPLINVDDVWNITFNGSNITGIGETVCIIDTGIDYTHPSLGNGWGNKVIEGYRFLDNGADYASCGLVNSECMDDYSHGTHVAGIVASDHPTYMGVAPDAKLISIKALNSEGSGYSTDIKAGIDWCVNNASAFNISVISMSLGDCTNHNSYCNSDDYASSIDAAVEQGIAVIVSAGNCIYSSCVIKPSCTTGPASPACVENATAIGAVNDIDDIYYQRGNLFELLAPGVSIYSATFSGSWTDKSGTSMSAPHVSGAVALLQQTAKLQNGSVALSPRQIELLLNSTGKVIDDSGGSGNNFKRIDIQAAVLALDSTGPVVNFNSPTPANGMRDENNSIIINVTVVDSFNNISTCILDLNGSNSTMIKVGTGNSVYCYAGRGNFTYTPYTYKVYAKDILNNTGYTEIYTFTRNAAPNITSNYPASSSFTIAEPNSQLFNITYLEANDMDQTYISWYREGVYVKGSSTNYTFEGNYSTSGTYNITVSLSDARLTDLYTWIMTVNDTPVDLDLPIVNFTSLTPLNYTQTNNVSISINATAIDVTSNISSCLLEWNGTNESMTKLGTGASVACYINKSITRSGTFSYRVYATDVENNTGESELRLIVINNTAPTITSYFPSQSTFFIAEPNNQTFNITYEEINGDTITFTWLNNGASVGGSTGYNFIGNYSAAGTYNISVYVSDGSSNDSQTWTMTVNNTNSPPVVQSLRINSTDNLNRSNGTLNFDYNFYDFDDDSETINETKWYKDNILNSSLANWSSIPSALVLKDQYWVVWVRSFDGTDWSNWQNASMTIGNTAPILASISNVTVNETQTVNLSASGSDVDSDSLTYGINNSRFSQSTNVFTWVTNLSDSGTHVVRINVTDGTATAYQDVHIIVLDTPDFDNDGVPDINDTDDDNDEINDTDDFVLGNSTYVNSINTNISIEINGTTNLTQIFNTTLTVNISDGNSTIVEFNWTFNSTNILNLGNMTVNRQVSGASNGSFIIKGLVLSDGPKNVLLDRINGTDYICIRDEEIESIDNITSGCNEDNEYFLNCNGVVTSGYSCNMTNNGTKYKVTGLSHSGIREQCQDNDGDGYGIGCAFGSDCNDNDASKKTGSDCITTTSTSSGGGGSGGGSITIPADANTISSTFISMSSSQKYELKGLRSSLAVTELTFYIKGFVLKGQVTITKTTLPSNIRPAKNVYQYFEITPALQLSKEDIQKADIRFRVETLWLKNNNFDKNKIKLLRYNNNWEEYPSKILSEEENYTYYGSSMPGFSYFAIASEKIAVIEEEVVDEINETGEVVVDEINETEDEEKKPWFTFTWPEWLRWPDLSMINFSWLFWLVFILVASIATGAFVWVKVKENTDLDKLVREEIKYSVSSESGKKPVKNVLSNIKFTFSKSKKKPDENKSKRRKKGSKFVR